MAVRVKELKKMWSKLDMMIDQVACITDLIGNFQRQKSEYMHSVADKSGGSEQ